MHQPGYASNGPDTEDENLYDPEDGPSAAKCAKNRAGSLVTAPLDSVKEHLQVVKAFDTWGEVRTNTGKDAITYCLWVG
jgi:hypothetical protein